MGHGTSLTGTQLRLIASGRDLWVPGACNFPALVFTYPRQWHSTVLSLSLPKELALAVVPSNFRFHTPKWDWVARGPETSPTRLSSDKPSHKGTYRGQRTWLPYFQKRSVTFWGNILHFTNTRSEKVAAICVWLNLFLQLQKWSAWDVPIQHVLKNHRTGLLGGV